MKTISFALFVLLLAVPARAAANLTEADAAFEAGDYPRALGLYDEVLRRRPETIPALVRSGMLLSWDKRYAQAIVRYDRVLLLEPAHPQASVERAKVLSWSGRNVEAAAAFREVLARDPGDREARLGLARSLSWAGRQDGARREYRALLDRDPRDADALVGMAQTHAWSGDLPTARREYDRALTVAPGQRDALLGLAYLDLWSGQGLAAERAGADLEARFPGDAEIAELRREVRKARAPWVRTSYDRVDDSDDNSLDTARLEAGMSFRLFDVGLGLTRSDLRHPAKGDSTLQGIYGTLAFRPTRRQLFTARAGTQRLDPPGSGHDRTGVYRLSWIWGTTGPWVVTAGWDHDPYLYSSEILSHRVMVDTWQARFDGSPSRVFRVSAGLARADLDGDAADDDNARNGFDAGAWLRHAFGRVTGEAGYVFRTMDYDRDLDLGYFDPQDFRSHLLQARAFGPVGGTRAYWDATLEGGRQSFTLGGVHVSGDEVLGGSALLGLPLGQAMALEATASRTDYALQSATGFESRQVGLRLRWLIGVGR